MEYLWMIALVLSVFNLVLALEMMRRMKENEIRVDTLDDVMSETREQVEDVDNALDLLYKERVEQVKAHNTLVGRVRLLEAKRENDKIIVENPEIDAFQDWIRRTDEEERKLEAQEKGAE